MVTGQRHILMLTIAMVSFLSNAKTWYIDGTFRIIRHPIGNTCICTAWELNKAGSCTIRNDELKKEGRLYSGMHRAQGNSSNGYYNVFMTNNVILIL